MSDLRDLYQEVIIDHSKHPRNHQALEDAHHHADGFNPLCGDKVSIYVKVENDLITDISFQGCGCAISTASASLLTEKLQGKNIQEAENLFQDFHKMLTQESRTGLEESRLGKLAVLAGVREYPSRVKCATLPWHTLHAALADQKKLVSTE